LDLPVVVVAIVGLLILFPIAPKISQKQPNEPPVETEVKAVT
jgi:hypothetical protein